MLPRRSASPITSAIAAAARLSSAASCAIACSGMRRRISTSRCSASRQDQLPAVLDRARPRRAGRPELPRLQARATIDVALPRRESKTGRGHKGFAVEGDPFMSFEEAARRRDFTINAISWDPLTGDYLDPFNGRGDLERASPARRRPATLRRRQPARAARAAVRRAIRATLDRRRARSAASIPLDDLPAERIWGEFEKLLLQAPRPSIGFALALDLGVVDAAAARAACRSSAARRSRSGIPKATSGRTR